MPTPPGGHLDACRTAGCPRPARKDGLCSTHYDHWLRAHGRPLCAVDGCSLAATERGWCHGHYLRWVRLGDVQAERAREAGEHRVLCRRV